MLSTLAFPLGERRDSAGALAGLFDVRAGTRLFWATLAAALLSLLICTSFYLLEVERLTNRQLAALAHHLGQVIRAADQTWYQETTRLVDGGVRGGTACDGSPLGRYAWHIDGLRQNVFRQVCAVTAEGRTVAMRFLVDDSRLAASSQPELRLFLVHRNQVVANSLGAAGQGEAEALDPGRIGRVARTGAMMVQASIRWDGDPDSPLLVAQQRLSLPFSLGEIAAAGLVLWAVLAGVIWLTVGLWLQRALQQIQFLAYHDPLTGLINRAALHVGLPHMLAESRRNDSVLAVFYLDLDHFKTINDSLGHAMGDQVLCEVARRLRTCIRDTDFVARLGGDEFVLVLGELREANDAAQLARKVIDELAAPMQLDGHALQTSTSIGIATHPGSAETAETLIQQADCAMYAAKQLGRGRHHFYDEDLGREADRRFRMEQQMRRALVEEAFEVHYQPVVARDDSSRLTGFEALVRWRQDGRLIPPDEFIPLAEENGLIVPLGGWVLRTACKQLCAWREAFPAAATLSISVNVSVSQLNAADLAEHVAAALAESNLPPASLILELTESLYAGVQGNIEETLGRLRQLGIRLAMDDFGTGYSSLAQLTRLPLDRLKIDRAFVRNIEQDPNELAIARTIIAIGQQLDLEIVAEGVETAEQAAILADSGCRLMQGWLFGRALPAPEASALLQRSN